MSLIVLHLLMKSELIIYWQYVWYLVIKIIQVLKKLTVAKRGARLIRVDEMFSQLWKNDLRLRQEICNSYREFGTLKELFSSHFGLKCHQHILGNVVGNQYWYCFIYEHLNRYFLIEKFLRETLVRPKKAFSLLPGRILGFIRSFNKNLWTFLGYTKYPSGLHCI